MMEIRSRAGARAAPRRAARHLVRSALLATALGATAACAARGIPAPVGEPAADPAALATEFREATTVAGPRQATFAWTLDEGGSRVRGRGVARFEAPTRARLDLFGARGETYLAAALVGEEYRLPQGANPQGVPLPSPSLLWAAIGVVRPPQGAELISATTRNAEVALRYQLGPREVLELRGVRTDGTIRLVRAERIGPTGVVETVQMDGETGAPTRTRYRDLSAFRELTLEFENVANAEPFPESIWRPGAGGL